MTVIVSIVEGDGEVTALPILLRRIGAWLSPEMQVEVKLPIRVKRDRFLNREEEFKRMLELAALKCDQDGWILVLLDADDECPVELGGRVSERARNIIPHRSISVVLANREYEAWFIAAAGSLNGCRGFTFNGINQHESEAIRGAKEWMGAHMPNGKYREVADQPAFSASMDLQLALDNSRSFRKLCNEWSRNMVPGGE